MMTAGKIERSQLIDTVFAVAVKTGAALPVTEQAVPFLKKHLTPTPRPNANVARFIADLDSDNFTVRQKATEGDVWTFGIQTYRAVLTRRRMVGFFIIPI
jgi:hypothetical protein